MRISGVRTFQGNPSAGDDKYMGVKNSNVQPVFRSSKHATEGHSGRSYHGTLIGSRMFCIKWCYFDDVSQVTSQKGNLKYQHPELSRLIISKKIVAQRTI